MKKENGITLVALIITIIILVILAAVSINAAYQSGIINYAVNGTQQYVQGASAEESRLASAESMFQSAITRVESAMNAQSSSEELGSFKFWENMDEENEVTYYFVIGSTWAEWIESEYCTEGFEMVLDGPHYDGWAIERYEGSGNVAPGSGPENGEIYCTYLDI